MHIARVKMSKKNHFYPCSGTVYQSHFKDIKEESFLPMFWDHILVPFQESRCLRRVIPSHVLGQCISPISRIKKAKKKHC
jgi:hypothetical protein